MCVGFAALVALVAPAGAHAAPALSLNPKAATKQAGTPHTLTATLTDGGSPVAGATVRFVYSVDTFFGTCDETGTNVATTGSDGKAKCTFTYSAGAPADYRAFHDADDDGQRDADEATDTASVRWLSNPPAAIALDPKGETVIKGTERCTTARVTDSDGAATSDRDVHFSVSGANAAVAPVTVRTDGGGGASLCYTGDAAGTDTITAYADTDEDGTRDSGEPQTTTTRRWLAQQPAIAATPLPSSGEVDTPFSITATVTSGGSPVAGVHVHFHEGNFFAFVHCSGGDDLVTD